jgi:tetratricopeptide (TPR) repeat protein
MKRYLTWFNFVKLVCGVVAVGLIICLIVKLVGSNIIPSLANIKLEVLLVALAITILLPTISQLEAFGVKLGIKEQIDELSAWAKASPYYSLASEYEDEEDYLLAEQYYLKSLEECPTFWPSIFGLASVYDDIAGKARLRKEYNEARSNYDKAITNYKKVISLDNDNVYAYNNLAAAYLAAPPPTWSPAKSLKYADEALENYPSLGSASYYKGEALNYLGKYSDARAVLQAVVDNNLMENDQPYWGEYELAIANSNSAIQVTQEGLDRMLDLANHDGEGEWLLRILKAERERFSEQDRFTIDLFCERQKNSPGPEIE